jgi:hypothetical protein
LEKRKNQIFIGLTPGINPYQKIFFVKQIFFRFFLLSFIVLFALFSYVTYTQAQQRKLENEENQRLVELTPG